MSEFGQGSFLGCNFSTLTNSSCNISHQQSYSATENGRVEKRPGIVSVCDPRSCYDAWGACTVCQQSSNLMQGREDSTRTDPYQHKTETIRLVNERLGNQRVATSDGTVGAIACLVILEVCPRWSIFEHPKTEKHLQPGAEWSCSNC